MDITIGQLARHLSAGYSKSTQERYVAIVTRLAATREAYRGVDARRCTRHGRVAHDFWEMARCG